MTGWFDEEGQALPDDHLDALLSGSGFVSLVALVEGRPVGCITAHELPMTRSAGRELLVYDLAVDPGFRRRGIGRALVEAVRLRARERDCECVFIPVDREDREALAFYHGIGGKAMAVVHVEFAPAPSP